MCKYLQIENHTLIKLSNIIIPWLFLAFKIHILARLPDVGPSKINPAAKATTYNKLQSTLQINSAGLPARKEGLRPKRKWSWAVQEQAPTCIVIRDSCCMDSQLDTAAHCSLYIAICSLHSALDIHNLWFPQRPSSWQKIASQKASLCANGKQ